jgi:hypothetical protein
MRSSHAPERRISGTSRRGARCTHSLGVLRSLREVIVRRDFGRCNCVSVLARWSSVRAGGRMRTADLRVMQRFLRPESPLQTGGDEPRRPSRPVTQGAGELRRAHLRGPPQNARAHAARSRQQPVCVRAWVRTGLLDPCLHNRDRQSLQGRL